jgi:hypothetical protein
MFTKSQKVITGGTLIAFCGAHGVHATPFVECKPPECQLHTEQRPASSNTTSTAGYSGYSGYSLAPALDSLLTIKAKS